MFSVYQCGQNGLLDFVSLSRNRILPVALAFGSFAVPAEADVFDWINSVGGGFHSEPHWSPAGGPPGAKDTARFQVNGDFEVLLSEDTVNQQLIVNAAGLSLNLGNHSYTISGDDPGVSFQGASTVFGGALFTQYLYIQGLLEFEQPGSNWENAERIYVGLANPGVFDVHNGADVSTWRTYVAGELGVPGSLIIRDKGTSYSCSGLMIVGANGDGSLDLRDQALLVSAGGEIAGDIGSSGAALVQSGAFWDILDNTYVGLKDHGTLTIQNGGSVHSTSYVGLGEEKGSFGQAFILDLKGPGDSVWNIDGDARIGQLGAGSMLIQTAAAEDHATLNVGSSLHIGGPSLNLGQITVDGPGSTINLNPESKGAIVVGANGIGALTVTNGAGINSPNGEVAGDFGSIGTATITNNSHWNLTNKFAVGLKGHGELLITNGSSVVSGTHSSIGDVIGSTGAVSIIDTNDPGNATWTMSGNLYVGYSGSGELDLETSSIDDHASLTVGPNLFAGYNETAVADIEVTGPGSAVHLIDAVLGYHGSAHFAVTNGALFDATGTVHLAEFPTAHGTLIMEPGVDGLPTSLSCSELNVGLRGVGEMCINDAGTLQAPAGIVGAAVGADGTLCLDGESVVADFSSYLDVGQRGVGTLAITDATVTSPIVKLGNESTGNGTINMAGGELTVTTGALYLGFHGHGEMNMSEGAVVNAHALPDGLVIAAHLGSTGSLTMTDPGTLMDVERQFAMERVGSALISNGAELRCRKGISPSGSAGIIATNATSIATLTLETNGLMNCVDGFLVVGFRNATNGTMLIHNQGKATSVGGFIGREPGAIGHATVTGAGSEWINTAPLTIGELGVGKLTVNDDGVVQAPTIINGLNGTLEGEGGLLIGNVTNKKLVKPGTSSDQTGIIEINGNFSQTATGKFAVDLGGSTPGLHDQLLVDGNVALNGTLEIATIPGFKPQPGSTYQVVLACSGCTITGAFSQVVPSDTYEIIYDTDSVIVKVPGELKCNADIAPPTSGNGIVDVDDLLLVINNWGLKGANDADITGDGNVDVDDLLAVINAWGVCQ